MQGVGYIVMAVFASIVVTIYRAGGVFPVLYWIYRSQAGYLYYRHWYLQGRIDEEPHSVVAEHKIAPGITVVIIPLLDSNYAYLITQVGENGTTEAIVVDPSEGPAVLEEMKARNVGYVHAVLNTHHHWDHSGGNVDIKAAYPEATVCCGEEVAGLTRMLEHRDVCKFGQLRVETLKVPCHTAHHVIYVVTVAGQGGSQHGSASASASSVPPNSAVFTGDTVFVAGCGKFFEGDAGDMYTALHKTVMFLPDSCFVFPGHEYTVSNLFFAVSVEPDNEDAQRKLVWAQKQRSEQKPTVPSTIGEEKAYNPFFRVSEDAARRKTGKTDPVEVMQELRSIRNRFVAQFRTGS